jgi:hypothetical protein
MEQKSKNTPRNSAFSILALCGLCCLMAIGSLFGGAGLFILLENLKTPLVLMLISAAIVLGFVYVKRKRKIHRCATDCDCNDQQKFPRSVRRPRTGSHRDQILVAHVKPFK